MRFDDRTTGAVDKSAPNAKIVHIDVDPSELGKVIRPTVGVAADAKLALRGILGHFEETEDVEGCAEWREEISRTQEPEKRAEESARGEYGPIRIMDAIKTAAGEEVRLSGGEVGLRRAEFEGQLDRIAEEPQLLGLLADSYADAHPEGPEFTSVQVVQRRFELVDGAQTGDYEDRIVVEHRLEDGE